MNDFYEDDEPIEEVLAAFERGEKGVTRRPGFRIVDAPDFVTTGTNMGVRARVRLSAQGPARPSSASTTEGAVPVPAS